MDGNVMVGMPAAHLQRVVAQVSEDLGPFAEEAGFVVDEILRLRNAGHLSKTIASDIDMLIYQRQMHSWHTGDFAVTAPIENLKDQIDRHQQESLPEVQIDPIQVHPRIADIAAGIPLPIPAPKDLFEDTNTDIDEDMKADGSEAGIEAGWTPRPGTVGALSPEDPTWLS